MIVYSILSDCILIYNSKTPFSFSGGKIAADSSALSIATKQYLLIIRVKTLNRWEHAETWGTDHHTYPSKNVEDEETLRKRTDVWGHGPNRKPVLGIWSTGLVSNESG